MGRKLFPKKPKLATKDLSELSKVYAKNKATKDASLTTKGKVAAKTLNALGDYKEKKAFAKSAKVNAKAKLISAKAERAKARQGAAKTRYRAAAVSSSIASYSKNKYASDQSLQIWNKTMSSDSKQDSSEATTGSDTPGNTSTQNSTPSANNNSGWSTWYNQ